MSAPSSPRLVDSFTVPKEILQEFADLAEEEDHDPFAETAKHDKSLHVNPITIFEGSAVPPTTALTLSPPSKMVQRSREVTRTL
jgi:hypothetical protein